MKDKKHFDKAYCEKCFKENGECIKAYGECPFIDYGENYSTALIKELRAQNGEE